MLRSLLLVSEQTGRFDDNIDSELRAHALDGRVAEVDCRSTLCIATLKFSNERDAVQVYEITHPDQNDRFVYFTADGDGLTVLYFMAPPGVNLSAYMDGKPS